MVNRAVVTLMFLFGPGLLAACNNDSPISDGGEGGGEDGGSGDGGEDGGDADCTSDDECSEWEICDDSECVDGDRNNSADEAEAVLWDETVGAWLNPADDVDYFSFSAEGGEYIRLTLAHEDEEGNTVVTLRDPNGKVVAWTDDYPTGSGISGADSILYAYLPDAGDYVVSVEDDGSYYGTDDAYGSPDFYYEFELSEWTRYVVEADSSEEPGAEVVIDRDLSWTAVGYLIGETGDSDWIEVEYAPDSGEPEVVDLTIDGLQDMGGSSLRPHARLWTTDGELLMDKPEIGPAEYGLFPGVTEGSYLLELTDEGGAGADDAWGFAFLIAREADDQYTPETEPNDLLAQAEDIALAELETESGNEYSVGSVQGTLDSADDVDMFALEAPHAGDDSQIIVCLTSSPYGSVVAPVVRVLDAVGNELAVEVGDPDADRTVTLDGVLVDTAGLYHIEVTAPEDSPVGAGAWYRFTTYATSFSPSSYACP